MLGPRAGRSRSPHRRLYLQLSFVHVREPLVPAVARGVDVAPGRVVVALHLPWVGDLGLGAGVGRMMLVSSGQGSSKATQPKGQRQRGQTNLTIHVGSPFWPARSASLQMGDPSRAQFSGAFTA